MYTHESDQIEMFQVNKDVADVNPTMVIMDTGRGFPQVRAAKSKENSRREKALKCRSDRNVAMNRKED